MWRLHVYMSMVIYYSKGVQSSVQIIHDMMAMHTIKHQQHKPCWALCVASLIHTIMIYQEVVCLGRRLTVYLFYTGYVTGYIYLWVVNRSQHNNIVKIQHNSIKSFLCPGGAPIDTHTHTHTQTHTQTHTKCIAHTLIYSL